MRFDGKYTPISPYETEDSIMDSTEDHLAESIVFFYPCAVDHLKFVIRLKIVIRANNKQTLNPALVLVPPSITVANMPYPKYPAHWKTCMDENGPGDKAFRVPDGKLLYHPGRDSRFPYIYEMQSHPLDPTPKVRKRILVYVIDTSEANLVKLHNWENSLSVPLGPDSLINSYGGCFCVFVDQINNFAIGLHRVDSSAALFARRMGCHDPKEDVFLAAYSPG